VAVGALELDREAVRDDLLAGLPGVDARARAQHDAGQVGADDVVRQVVALGVLGQLAVALEEPERRDGLEDRGPHGVVVDRAGHDGDEGLTRGELGQRHVVDVQALAGVLVPRGNPLEHRLLVLVDGHGPVRLGQVEVLERLGGAIAGHDGVEDVLH